MNVYVAMFGHIPVGVFWTEKSALEFNQRCDLEGTIREKLHVDPNNYKEFQSWVKEVPLEYSDAEFHRFLPTQVNENVP